MRAKSQGEGCARCLALGPFRALQQVGDRWDIPVALKRQNWLSSSHKNSNSLAGLCRPCQSVQTDIGMELNRVLIEAPPSMELASGYSRNTAHTKSWSWRADVRRRITLYTIRLFPPQCRLQGSGSDPDGFGPSSCRI